MSEYIFKEEDVPDLVEALAGVAHKWEEIAVAVRLPEVVRAECGEKSSPVLKLHSVLYKWIVGGHSNTKPPTVKNLKKAIEGPLVQRPDVANQLEKSVSSTAPTAAVTKESILFKFKNKLCLFYSSLAEIPSEIPRVWPPVVNKNFIDLALVKTSSKHFKSDYSVCGNADDVLAKKEKIKYEQAFGAHSDSKLMLVLGRPGSGKTTLVHKVVKDWAQGLVLKGAELVYLISLRSLTSEHNKLPNILSPFHFQENTLQEVSDSIEKVNGKGVCFILDGFDEYPSQNYEKSLVGALLNRSYLPEAMVVVTSRPAAASALPNKSSFKQIEVFGFSRKDIFKYIGSFPYSRSSSSAEHFPEKLKSFLESRPRVLDLCYLPVNVAIICFLYDYDPELLPETQTEMYKFFTTSIIIRQLKQYNPSFTLQSLEDLKGEEAEMFKNLCSIAFEMTANSRQVMSRGELNIDNKNSLGLVTIDVSAQLSGEYQNSYSFLHLTLQEFLAAYHISKLNYGQLLDVIKKTNFSYFLAGIVWKFYFGIANFSNEEELKKAEKIIQQRYVGREFPILCAYEAKHDAIIKLVCMKDFNILHFYHTYDLLALAYVVSEAASPNNKAIPTTHLRIVNFNISCSQLDLLVRQLSDRAIGHLEELSVVTAVLNFSSNVKPLADKLQSGTFKSLKQLTLRSSNIGDDGALTLAAGLRNHHLLTLLDLHRSDIGAVGTSALMLCTCPLKVLNLSCNEIGDEGARAVARRLRGSPDFQTIFLSFCEISAEGVEALADATSRDTLYVMKLCNIGSATSKEFKFFNVWKLPGEHFDDKLLLNISGNEQLACDVNDGIALFGCFKNLIGLDLSHNQLGQDGAMAIAEYVLHQDNCSMLQYLDLSHNDICDVKSVILKLLNHDILERVVFSRPLRNMPVIDLNRYKFDCDEVIALARGIQQMEDFNYSQIHYPMLDIDITDTVLDMEQSLAVLGALKHCSRIQNIKFTLRIYEDEDRDIATELRSAFVHEIMDRIIFLKYINYFYLEYVTIECPHVMYSLTGSCQ